MKIIIADDDRLIRYYTQSLIAEVMNETYEIIEAENGKVLVDLCMKHSPDIVFADIKMPYLDGISAIEQAKVHCPQTTFVVLTAFADFAFAQRCVSLGVSDYLLKPIERETLEKLLHELKIKIKQEISLDNFKFQHKIISLFNNPVLEDSSEMLEASMEQTVFLYFEFFIFCTNYDEMYHSIYSSLSNELGDLAENILKYGSRNVLFHSKSGNLSFVVQSSANNERFIINSINIILKSYYEKCSISCLYTRSLSIHQLIENATVINQKQYSIFACKTGTVHAIEKVMSPLSADELEFLKLFSNVITAYIDRNEPQYTLNIKRILQLTKLSKLRINFEDLKLFTSNIMGQNFNVYNEKHFFEMLLATGENMKINLTPSSLDKIDLIKEYIDANYMHDICITTIAENYNLSPNYLSKLFHEKIGIKFTDYLTQVRIYNSKLLLASSNDISIKTVSSMVGYNSPRYFSNIFYKLTNLSPSDYKKSLKPAAHEAEKTMF